MRIFQTKSDIEFIVGVVLIIVLAISSLSLVGGAAFLEKERAEMAKNATLAKFPIEIRQNIEVINAICDDWDTDHNSRVRCIVNYMRGTFNSGEMSDIKTDVWECPSSFSDATSCIPMRYGTIRLE